VLSIKNLRKRFRQILHCNITQIMYDRSNGGRMLRTYAGCSLAWWHSYKWATKRIMVVYATDFIAPLFHYLFPDRQFDPMKSSHSASTTILSYIRLAYPRFKDSLQQALGVATISVRQRTILQNLQHLCEFFIPVVRDFIMCVCYFVCSQSCYTKSLCYTTQVSPYIQ
jgi:hypothetical protein